MRCDTSEILGFVDPFRLISKEDSRASLFDLHCSEPQLGHLPLRAASSQAGLSCFWDRSYGTYHIQQPSKTEVPKVKTKLKLAAQKADEFFDNILFDESFTSTYEPILKDKEFDRIKELPPMMRLQASLVKAYPGCDDVNTKSAAGFQPHLTLGQFRKANLQKSMDQIKEQLFADSHKKLEFDVDSICIITRESEDDPFKIVATIPLPNS